MGKKSKRGVVRNKAQHGHGSAKQRRSSGTKSSMNKAAVAVANESISASNESISATNSSDTETMSIDIPEGLEAALSLFPEKQQDLAKYLCMPPNNQSHLFEKWTAPTESSDAENTKKREFMSQLERMDEAYPDGGLAGYIKNAKILLERSKQGLNPLDGWTPSVPQGQTFELGSKEYAEVESFGMSEMGKCCFVLVAGGLGERLGYTGIKIGLPVELATETTYIQYYIEVILAIQSRYAGPSKKLPLCIMVSNDTLPGTLKLLNDNNNFGMDNDQITIVKQGEGVPALLDNDAHIALDPSNMYKIESKPHGHGDIHSLLYSNGVVKNWLQRGLEWVVFFQDTNGLAFHTLPLALGVSKKLDLIMNSMAVPRKAKQAIGGIAKLTKPDGQERTVNVEYNQLDPLLRATGYPDGDVNDAATGFSPFPGNINQILFHLKEYSNTLDRTKGVMPEFVNPKYADTDKTIFKKPTRLECMMQDFPTVLLGDEAKRVGFTSIASDLCFSPVKNATIDGVAMQQSGTHPGVAATGEADQYGSFRKILSSLGCNINVASPVVFNGITVIPGPEIVLKPSFVLCPSEYKHRFPNPSKINISDRSSLVVNGSGIVIESLDLDGALVIDCEEGAQGVISNLVVKNSGWKKVSTESSECSEVFRMRGYSLRKDETKSIVLKKDHPTNQNDNVDLSAPAKVSIQKDCGCAIS